MEKLFDQQINHLLTIDYPKASGLAKKDFLALIEPLRNNIQTLPHTDIDLERGYLPFVIVIKSTVIPVEKSMSLVNCGGKHGITKLYPHVPEDFKTIDSVSLPESDAYLLVDIDRGKETINVRPNEALIIIEKKQRSPLTIDEGVALVTHYPEFLIKNNCFSLLASRVNGNQRVPAIWINAQKNPNLGWCWDGNPHTWLGSASCKKRMGVK